MAAYSVGMRNHHICLPPPHVLEALRRPPSLAEAGPHHVKYLVCQFTPEALLESLNRAADLPASERNRRRREYEAYRSAKV